MNDKVWIICVPDNGGTKNETITCESCGVAQDGSLLCFIIDQGPQGPQPMVTRGYAPGEWKTFYRSPLRSN